MKKELLIFFVIVAIFLVSGQGCKRAEEKEGVYVGGTDGVNIEFVEDAPSSTGNFQDIKFPIEVKLTNNGESEVREGSAGVRLVGAIISNAFEWSVVGNGEWKNLVSTTTKLFALDDSGAIPDSTILNLGNAKLKAAHPIGPMWSPTVVAQLCYSYTTNLHIADLCIPGGRGQIGISRCEVDSSKNLLDKGDVSSGPVQVTSLTESRTSDGVSVKMIIENLGGGVVFKNTNVATCLTDDNLQDLGKKNRVKVTVNGVESCTFTETEQNAPANVGYVRLTNGRGTLRCTKTGGGSGSAYTDTLTAALDYNYVEEASKTITIEKA